MKKLLNTLYITTPGAYLAREGETLLVRVAREARLRIPIHTLASVVCFGRVACSPGAMDLCGRAGVAIAHLSENGRFRARIEGPVSGNVLLRRQQYRCADDEHASAAIATAVVAAKIANCRTVLQRGLRDHPDAPGAAEVEAAVRRLGRLLGELTPSLTLDAVRGLEGDAARAYFRVFDHLILTQRESFFFHNRSRRPPRDNVNALLSFTYTLLAHDVAAALQGVGLDPAVGYLHRERPGRPSLALDLMEEVRAFLADRLILSLVNLRQVQAGGFRLTESGGVEMDDATRKTLLVAWQRRKQEEIQHPFLGERIAIGLLPHVQAMLLARRLRGDLDAYPPFVSK